MFKVKDLFIELPHGSCLDPDSPTYIPAPQPPGQPGGNTTLCCGGWSIPIPIPMPVPGTPVQYFFATPFAGTGVYYAGSEMQAAMKEYLKTALEQAAKSAGPSGRATQPQTVAEVEMLEEKLSAALEELRARKAELRKSDKK